jgi:hypothetical protein
MTQQFGKHAFDQANKLFKDAFVPGKVQALAEQGVAASKNFCEMTAAAVQERGKALTEIAELAWDSTKLLNEKVAQNWAANFHTTCAAAQLMAGAKSLPEIARLQIDFFQTLSTQTTEQTKELVGLSTRTSQHLIEKVQAAATKPLKPAV